MRKAFTLIELLVVVAIIALLISILLPALNDAKRQARTTVCMSNVRQVSMGFVLYSQDWNGMLPGSTWDYVPPGNYNRGKPMCWLGTINGKGDKDHVPSWGTIFKLIGEQTAVYKCPEDKLENRALRNNGAAEKPLYSYTAPPFLTGAPTSLLKMTRWPENAATWNNTTDWDKATGHSLPWMLVEEDEVEYLAFVTDSAWSNVDIPTNRHKERATIGHIDGSATVRKYQRFPVKLDAWKTYYELSDGRIVSAGWWGGSVKFGYIRSLKGLNQ